MFSDVMSKYACFVLLTILSVAAACFSDSAWQRRSCNRMSKFIIQVIIRDFQSNVSVCVMVSLNYFRSEVIFPVTLLKLLTQSMAKVQLQWNE